MEFLRRIDRDKLVESFSESFVEDVLEQMEPFIDSSIHSLEEAMGGVHEYQEEYAIGLIDKEQDDAGAFEEFIRMKEVCRDQMLESMKDALEEQVGKLLPKMMSVILAHVEEELRMNDSDVNLS